MYDPERITLFAKTDARGKQVPFGIKAKDRTRHVYVIGKTGMGKSTLLENMAVQDIKNGEGLAFIDPHGQTAETLLDYIPEERIKDVLYFAPHDMGFPVSFNVMEDVGPDKRHLVVSGLMSVFKKIWVDAWSARMEYILSNTLLALLEYPGSTLLGVNRMLSDKDYRKKVVDNIQDPSVKSFWVDEFAKYNERYMQEAGDSIKNKIGQFTSNPLIRNIVGQPHSSFDIRKIMDEKKILIMNLSKGLVGESNANLLGSMLTTRIYLAAMSRADMSVQELNKMPNFYFYVDEFQSFANATFANILSEARKYKLNLTIAHQYVEQMEEDVKNAVFGNVGTTIAFRVGPFDAEVLETIYAPKFYAVDICNLGFAQIYLTLMIDGIGSAPFSAITLPPISHQGISYKEMIIAESRRQFAKTREEVENSINAWHKPEELPSKRKSVDEDKSSERKFGDKNFKKNDGDKKPFERKNNKDERDSEKPSFKEKRDFSERKEVKDEPLRNEGDLSKRAVSEKSKSDKNVDDLRAILKNIASTSKDNKKKPEIKNKTEDKKPEPKKEVKPPLDAKSDLRRALAGVVTGEVKAEHLPDKPKLESVKFDNRPKRDNPALRQALKETLDPKQLERMMRVSLNEKTPLK